MSMPESTSTDTNAGFIVGADPKQPLPTAAQWADVGNTSLSQNPLAQQPPQPPAEPQGTPEDVQTLIQQAVEAIVQRYPALRRHWLDEAGEIHAHVHIFVNGEEYLTLPEAERTPLQPQDSLDFFPPVAGGQA